MTDFSADHKDQLLRLDREVVWHAFTQMAEYEPFVIQRAEGCMLTDIDGREYLDGASSLWCNVHGHRHPKIDAAIRNQLDRVAHVTSLGGSNPTTIELAARLVEITPAGLSRVFFSGDGASAIEVALKMAFQFWRQCDPPQPQRTKYVALGDAYHGDTLGSVSVGGVERFHAVFRPLLFDVVRLPIPDRHCRPEGLGKAEARDHYLAQLSAALDNHAGEVAAVVLEPLVQGAAGMRMHPPGYLRGVRELTEKHDVLLIADEVATGFGRTGRMFACEHEDVSPDLLCLGKGLTAGYVAMAATLTTDRVWQAFLGRYEDLRTFFHGHSYGGNPLAAAAGVASLEVFEEEQTLEKLGPKIEQIARHLKRLSAHPHVGNARQCGMIAAVELVADKQRGEPFDWRERRAWQVCQATTRRGVWLRPLGDTIVIMPPLAVSAEEIERLFGVLGEALDEILR